MMNFRLLSMTDCPSTNTLAKEMARCAILENRLSSLEGTVLLAERQTNGRGRIGHTFSSPEGGLYFSLILAPKELTFDTTLITTMAAVAMVKALEKGAPDKDIQIKWVNDLFLEGKKLCGILAESVSIGSQSAVILGVGLNFCVPDDAFPPDLQNIATSLYHKSTPVAQKNALLFHFLEEFEYFYHLLPDTAFLDLYRAKSLLTGRTVFYQDPSTATLCSAKVLGIGPKAELIIDQNGQIIHLAAGEVSVKLTQP